MSDQIKQEEQSPQKKKSLFRSRKIIIILSIVTIIFTILAIKGIAVAKHFHKFSDGPHEFFMDKFTENLNLSEAQKAQVENLKKQVKEKMESNKSNRGSHIEEFSNEFRKDNLDRNRLLELSKEKETQMQDMKEFMMDKLIEFHNILTPEQRIKAVENMMNMKNKFHDRMEKFKDKVND